MWEERWARRCEGEEEEEAEEDMMVNIGGEVMKSHTTGIAQRVHRWI